MQRKRRKIPSKTYKKNNITNSVQEIGLIEKQLGINCTREQIRLFSNLHKWLPQPCAQLFCVVFVYCSFFITSFLFVVNGKPPGKLILSDQMQPIKLRFNCSAIDTIRDKLISFQSIRSEYLWQQYCQYGNRFTFTSNI